MIDDDAVRDSVVAKMARGQCAAPFCTSKRPVTGRYSFREDPTEDSFTVSGPLPALRRYDYPWCGLGDCEAWLVAQGLMGRLPHQSISGGRLQWRSAGEGWGLYDEAVRLVRVEPRGAGWASFYGYSTGFARFESLSQAQTLAERHVAETLQGWPKALPREVFWGP